MLQPRASRLPVVPLFSAPAPSLAASAEVVHAGSAPGLGRRGEMLSFGNQSPASTGICSRRSKCLQIEEGQPGQKGLETILCAPMNFRTCLLRPWPPSCPATAAPPRPRLSGKPCSERMPVWKGRVPTCAVVPEAGGCCAPASSSVSECPLLIVRWAAASVYHRRSSGHSNVSRPHVWRLGLQDHGGRRVGFCESLSLAWRCQLLAVASHGGERGVSGLFFSGYCSPHGAPFS